MADPALLPDRDANPLQAIRDDLQRRESEAANELERSARRQRLSESLTDRFRNLTSLAGVLLAPERIPDGPAFFPNLACNLLTVNEMLRDYDEEYPRYRILERLGRAAEAGVPALDTASSLLLLDPSADPLPVAVDLEHIQESPSHNVWPLWLTYILDQLLNSHNRPIKDNVPPDTTRDEWRKAELAFGCILFSDDSFRVLQESMDQAAGLLETALERGGYRTFNRPPGRVRDLIDELDPRALQWIGSEPLSLQLLQPPPSIEAITEPKSLRCQLDEVWTAANYLQIALDRWAAWFIDLKVNGDANPGSALFCSELARRGIAVLLTHRPNVDPFDSADEASLLAMLPPIPAWWMPGTDHELNADHTELIDTPRVAWQKDRTFLDQYYLSPEQRQMKAVRLRGAAARLIAQLSTFPLAAVASRRSPANCVNAANLERLLGDCTLPRTPSSSDGMQEPATSSETQSRIGDERSDSEMILPTLRDLQHRLAIDELTGVEFLMDGNVCDAGELYQRYDRPQTPINPASGELCAIRVWCRERLNSRLDLESLRALVDLVRVRLQRTEDAAWQTSIPEAAELLKDHTKPTAKVAKPEKSSAGHDSGDIEEDEAAPDEDEESLPQRPGSPTRAYCLLPRRKVRWIGEPIRIRPQLHELLGTLLDAQRWPIPFDAVAALFSSESDKRIKNAISELNNALETIHWPLTYSSRGAEISCE